SRYGTDHTGQPSLTYHAIIHITLHGDAPFAVPLVYKAAMADTFLAGGVDTKNIAVFRHTHGRSTPPLRPDGFADRKQRGGPRVPWLRVSRLAMAPAYKCRTPFVALAQTAIPQVLRYTHAV